WQAVRARLAGFEDDAAAPRELVSAALALRVQAALARAPRDPQDLEAARADLARLAQSFPGAERTARSALELARALGDSLASTAAPAARALRAEAADCLALAGRCARGPSFENLWLEASLRLELRDWTGAEAVLRAMLATFRDDARRSADLERRVAPALG